MYARQRLQLTMRVQDILVVAALLLATAPSFATEPAPDANLLAGRATEHLARGEIAAAIADFSAALELAPRRFDLLTGRSAAYELSGNDEAALADLDGILGPMGGPPVIVMREGDLARYRLRAGADIRSPEALPGCCRRYDQLDRRRRPAFPAASRGLPAAEWIS